MNGTRVSQVTTFLIAAVLGAATALANYKHLVIPPALQPALAMGATLFAGWVAPSIAGFSLRFATHISAALTVLAGVVAFALANITGMPQFVQAVLTGAVPFLTALLLPSASHPSALAPPGAPA